MPRDSRRSGTGAHGVRVKREAKLLRVAVREVVLVVRATAAAVVRGEVGAARAARPVVPFPVRHAVAVRVRGGLRRRQVCRRLRLLDPGRRPARRPGARAAHQVHRRFAHRRVHAAAVPAHEAAGRLISCVVPAPVGALAQHQARQPRPLQPGLGRLAVVCHFKRGCDELRDRQCNSERDERHDEAVHRSVVIGEGVAGVFGETVREVRRHGGSGKKPRQVAAQRRGILPAASAHGRAAAVPVEQHAHLGAAVDALWVWGGVKNGASGSHNERASKDAPVPATTLRARALTLA
jgi:hypothetical protein